jgi:hypothetical protein
MCSTVAPWYPSFLNAAAALCRICRRVDRVGAAGTIGGWRRFGRLRFG